MASVQFQNITKKFADHTVIQDFSLGIKHGEFIVLLGPSGCGKSTLLRMIAGLEAITSGDLLIGKHRVNELEPKDRQLAMVFQSYALYPHMTVAENIGFSLKVAGAKKGHRQKRVKEVADMLQLGDLLGRLPAQLSGGQRQRVAMGRAMIRSPRLFLFDEPLSNLDTKLRHQMRAEIKDLHSKVQTTTIYVTHDQVEAMTLADRIVIMRDGKIEQIGTPDEVFQKPANQFVAGFIGSPGMNFFQVTATQQDRAWLLEGDGIHITYPTTKPLNTTHLTLGVRPTDLGQAKPTLGDDGVGSFKCRTQHSELFGAEAVVTATLGNSSSLLYQVPGDHRPTKGERTEVFFAKSKLHLFEQQSR